MPVIQALLTAAAKVTTPLGLSAFLFVVVFATLWGAGRRRASQPIPNAAWVLFAFGLVIPAASALATEFVPEKLYRVQITVVDPQGNIVNDASVSANVGYMVSHSPGAYQVEIAPANVPPDRMVRITAERPADFLRGSEQIRFEGARRPAVTITLTGLPPATIRGFVTDRNGVSLDSVSVFVVGYPSEGVKTEKGSFVLPAHVPAGKRVRLYAAREGYQPTDEYYQVGDEPVPITLR